MCTGQPTHPHRGHRSHLDLELRNTGMCSRTSSCRRHPISGDIPKHAVERLDRFHSAYMAIGQKYILKKVIIDFFSYGLSKELSNTESIGRFFGQTIGEEIHRKL
jgi:hypothetical protein